MRAASIRRRDRSPADINVALPMHSPAPEPSPKSSHSAAARPDPSCTLVTPTYLPDLARCELLVESVQRCSPGLTHHLIVDHRDLPHFRHLADRTTIITSEDLLPWWVRRMPGPKSVWLSLRSRPTRGWIVQQVLKIAAASQLDADVSMFCDSDVAFIRPFAPEMVVDNGSVALVDVEFVNDEVRRWTSIAATLLGLGTDEVPARGHVGNLICWRRENVVALTARIEATIGSDWRAALMRLPTFSEYILYGAFTRGVIGYEAAHQHPSTVPLVKASWGVDLKDEQAFGEFFSDFDPATVAIMVHSNDRIDPMRCRGQLMWSGGA